MPLTQLDESRDLVLSWRLDVAPMRAWECLTQPDLLAQWLGELVSGSVAVGSEFVIDHGDATWCSSTVVACAAPSRLAFTWRFPDEPPSEVDITLDGQDGTTDLRLSHRGLAELSESYRDAWCAHLSYLEAAALGTPLPSAMFWRLHGTIATLAGRSRGQL